MDCVPWYRTGGGLACPAQGKGTIGQPLAPAEGYVEFGFKVTGDVMEPPGKRPSVIGSGGRDQLSRFGPVLHFNIDPRVFGDSLLNNAGAND